MVGKMVRNKEEETGRAKSCRWIRDVMLRAEREDSIEGS
jgi:hypothetical protein